MWASVIPSGSFWRHQYFIVYHLLHGLAFILSSSQPNKTLQFEQQLQGMRFGETGWGLLRQGHRNGPRPMKDHFGSWSCYTTDHAFYEKNLLWFTWNCNVSDIKLWPLESQTAHKYSWPSNKRSLNCADPPYTWIFFFNKYIWKFFGDLQLFEKKFSFFWHTLL